MEKIVQLREKIPVTVLKVVNDLQKEGFEAYLVGGCVRDLLLNLDPKDYDVATNAKPEEIAKIFPRSITTYAKFGTVLVLIPDEHKENMPIEVTTYRSEMDYFDGRWPARVEFTTKLSKDLGRRDFTINAFALQIKEEEDVVIDLFNGFSDLRKKIIRCVGTPIERMQEDGLRGIRACRLASVLQFEIESEVVEAIKKTIEVSKLVSVERIRHEFVRLIMESAKPSIGIELLRKTGLLQIFLPEILENIGVVQPEYHIDDVYHHLLFCVDVAPDDVKLAALFHDIGKARSKDNPPDEKYIERKKRKREKLMKHHFYNHDEVSAGMTQEIMGRLKFSKEEIEKTVQLVRYHMFYYQEDWSDAAVRRFIKRVGGEETVDLLFELRIADAASNLKKEFATEEIHKLQERIAEVREKEMFLNVSDLEIKGTDLLDMGITKGPKIGKILNLLLEEVLENPALNQKEKLIKMVKKLKIE